jgi:uncharacterized protein YjiS (DUF1127 family)
MIGASPTKEEKMSYQSRDRLAASSDLYVTPAAPKASTLRRLGLSWAVWRERTAMRRCLARMDARSLRDAGISPAAAAYESGKPFWEKIGFLR